MNKKEIDRVYKHLQKHGGCKLPDGCYISKFKRFYSYEYSLRSPEGNTITVTWDWNYIAELLRED